LKFRGLDNSCDQGFFSVWRVLDVPPKPASHISAKTFSVFAKMSVLSLGRINMDVKAEQLRALNRLLETGSLNEHQREIIERLIFATKQGSERAFADYVRTMDEAASYWAVNNMAIMKMF
jgi:hypothetical protein